MLMNFGKLSEGKYFGVQCLGFNVISLYIVDGYDLDRTTDGKNLSLLVG